MADTDGMPKPDRSLRAQLERLLRWCQQPEISRRILYAALGGLAAILLFGLVYLGFTVWVITRMVSGLGRAQAETPVWVFLPLVVCLGLVVLLARRISRGAVPPRRFRQRLGAAEDGGPEAIRTLALAYLHGAPGQPQDPASARFHLRRAAELGDRAAMLDLARLLQAGIGGPVDLKAAAAWLQQAAETANGGPSPVRRSGVGSDYFTTSK
jgi:hypothetical protein